ncbi:sugar transferase [Siccirubricoccus sp. G192]|uniref:sugar transferase n=1 Tax=Siccirubricoccus sp. G192 TaxID=2849651 RepID=UPI0021136188|nr:sugar transferase [Siccirubricoccus sp. G192]
MSGLIARGSNGVPGPPLAPRWRRPSWEALRPKAKRSIDVAVATMLLILVAPTFLLVALAVVLDGGPVFCRLRHVGCGGREFNRLRFRTTLRASQPAAPHPRPETTGLGELLCMLRLDELPQLLNVLRGDMSLVGPRPATREELDRFHAPLGLVQDYIAVRPGLVGPAQISDAGLSDRARIGLDAAYGHSPSLRTDLLLLGRALGLISHQRWTV